MRPLNGEIRRARIDEREAILDLLAEAFPGPNGTAPTASRETHPYLWHDGRVHNHFVYVHKGAIVGCVGLYPYEVRFRDVVFRTAGVGQVSCRKAYRGRGVMSAILEQVCAAADGDGLDFVWLWGDRRRYGHFGWAFGGQGLRFETFDKYLPPAGPAADFRPFDLRRDFAAVKRALRAAPCSVAMEDAELRLLLGMPDVRGYFLGSALLLGRNNGETVQVAAGSPERVARLLAHALRELRRRAPDKWKLAIECSPEDAVLTRACLPYYWNASIGKSANLRVGPLAPYLEKACRAAQPAVACGDDELGLVNTDTGEAVTLACRRGRLAVRAGAARGAARLSTLQLSEVLFGLLPPEVVLPRLRPDSPLRRVLNAPVHLSHLFAL